MIIAWIILINDNTMQTKDYILLIQVTVVFLTAIATAGISIAVVNLQQANSLKIEDYRQNVGMQQDKLRADLTQSVQESVNSSTEQLKARLGQLVPKKYESYHSMWKAATEYFLALKKLELGEYPESQLEEAEKTRNLAFGESLLAMPEDVEKYYTFMQEVLFIKEKAEDIKRESERLKTLWQNEGPQCGQQYEDLREHFYTRLLSLD
jgi:hypothetical protein